MFLQVFIRNVFFFKCTSIVLKKKITDKKFFDLPEIVKRHVLFKNLPMLMRRLFQMKALVRNAGKAFHHFLPLR